MSAVDSIPVRAIAKLGSTSLEQILCGPGTTGFLGDLGSPYRGSLWSGPVGSSLDSLPEIRSGSRHGSASASLPKISSGQCASSASGQPTQRWPNSWRASITMSPSSISKGQDVENGTIDHWIEHYAAKNVRFVPVPNYAARDRFHTGTNRWLHGPYNVLRYLLENPMDVVHVSEWRGSGYLSLLAKRQGLVFNDTLFIVKTSSPWIWNRLYGSQPLDHLDDLAKVHAERCSVEFADMVIGGSLHLLRWMSSQGYHIPRKRAFVQPNVATFDHLDDLATQRSWTRGSRHPINEVVFFGRLESRKGLFIFVQAIKRLMRQGKALPPQITFIRASRAPV